MKTIASTAAVVFIAAVSLTARPLAIGSVSGEDTKPAAVDNQPWLPKPAPAVTTTTDSPLVRAAKAARAATAARPRPTRPLKVITNDDLKKSKGKLTVLPARATKASGATADGALSATADRRAKQIENLKKVTADLETSLNALEDAYYDSDDPAYRDDVIQKKFNETKRDLDKSRALLAETERAAEKSSSTSAPHR